MHIFKACHTDQMGFVIKEEYYATKNAAKKALRLMMKAIKPILATEDDLDGEKPLTFKKPIIGLCKGNTSFEVMASVWTHHQYIDGDEWDIEVQHFHIENIYVNQSFYKKAVNL